MPIKIKILKLEKPLDYIQREVASHLAMKYKLLKDSDWTQLPDAGLTVGNVMEWRVWRNSVRMISYNDDMDKLLNEINEIQAKIPKYIKRKATDYKFVTNDFNYSSLDFFNQSCIMIAMELYPTKKTLYASLERNIKKSKTIDESLNMLLSLISHGY